MISQVVELNPHVIEFFIASAALCLLSLAVSIFWWSIKD